MKMSNTMKLIFLNGSDKMNQTALNNSYVSNSVIEPIFSKSMLDFKKKDSDCKSKVSIDNSNILDELTKS